MTHSITIPLSQLYACPENVRKTYTPSGIDELAANIKAIGLLQPLLVRADKNNAVIAGGRRLVALKQLWKSGDLDTDFPVPCTVANDEIDPAEMSLAENVVREDMHPIDQATAFKLISEEGHKIEQIALRFGVTEAIVRKRLKLADLSPVILEALRAGKISLEQAQSFTVRNDHEAQGSAYQALFVDGASYDQKPQNIREVMAGEDVVYGDDIRARYVGLEAYASAGGTYSQDLFSSNPRSIFLHNEDILESLTLAKLNDFAQPVIQEGWKEVIVSVDYNYNSYRNYKNSQPKKIELSAEDQNTLDLLRDELSPLEEKYDDAVHNSDEEQSLGMRIDRIHEQIDRLSEKQDTWSDRQKGQSIAVVYLDDTAAYPRVTRGLIPPQVTTVAPVNRSDDQNTAQEKTSSKTQEIPSVVELPASLVLNLTAHQSTAIASKMAKSPTIALALTVYQFLQGLLDLNEQIYSLGISAKETAYPSEICTKGQSVGMDRLQVIRDELMQKLPIQPVDDEPEDSEVTAMRLIEWCLDQDTDTLLEYLALSVALSVNTQSSNDSGGYRRDEATSLMEILGVNMNEFFVPSSENFFNRIPKLQIAAVLQEATSEPVKDDWLKMPKEKFALLAEGEVGAKNPLWLPEPMRPATEETNDEILSSDPEEDQHEEGETDDDENPQDE